MNSRHLSIMKLVATGNDFLFINGIDPITENWPQLNRSKLAKILCDRHFGVGADGLVIVERPADSIENAQTPLPTYKWDFYNSDGSSAEMCGNATRCFGRWIEKILDRSRAKLSTVAGIVEVTVFSSGRSSGRLSGPSTHVESLLPFVQTEGHRIVAHLGGRDYCAILLNTGVPHAVLAVDDLESTQNHLALIQAFRFHPDTGAKGANVTLIQALGPTHFKTVTFERGVEGFTLSCGTGVLAAAIAGVGYGLKSNVSLVEDYEAAGRYEKSATLDTPGGTLSVEILKTGHGVLLAGSAEIVFQTKIDLDSSLFSKIYGALS